MSSTTIEELTASVKESRTICILVLELIVS